MSESFRQSAGRKVVSRSSAHELGSVSHLLTTPDCQRVAAVIIGRGKKARLVDWAQLSGFGADAVMVGDDAALRPPGGDREEAAAHGKLELLGNRALSELGNELGIVDDVTFDPVTGAIEDLAVGSHRIPIDALIGSGSYAVVYAARHDPN